MECPHGGDGAQTRLRGRSTRGVRRGPRNLDAGNDFEEIHMTEVLEPLGRY